MKTSVRSPLPGTLSIIYYEDGEVVSKGTAIGEIECMKVNNRLSATSAGVIRWVRELGEVVGQDEQVAEIESDE